VEGTAGSVVPSSVAPGDVPLVSGSFPPLEAQPARASDAPRTTAIGVNTARRTGKLLRMLDGARRCAGRQPVCLRCLRGAWEGPASGVQAADLVRLGHAAHADAQRGVAQREVLALREVRDVGVALAHAVRELLLDLGQGPPVRL